VLYLDLDTLVVGQFSALFEVHLPQMRARGQTLAMGRNTHPNSLDYNSGVMLLVPDLTPFAALVQSINDVRHDSLYTADQALLNAVFTRSGFSDCCFSSTRWSARRRSIWPCGPTQDL
jgi:lipopolysaccharide biosynthesis glycosyltransferase